MTRVRDLRAEVTGTRSLVGLALRRDRVMIPVWVVVTGGVVASMPASLTSIYPSAADRARAAATMNAGTSVRAMYGPVFGDSTGALVAWRVGVIAGVLAALMSVMVVVRHTREEEQSGRHELLAAAGVGRRAHLVAALATAVAANAALGLVIVAGTAAQGVAGALALGAGVAGTGVVFAAVAALTAQVSESARTARGLAVAVLTAAFALRAAGDADDAAGASPLTWVSPLGWLENLRPFAGERWWVPALVAGVSAGLCALAWTAAGRRDSRAGLVAPRPGPAGGGPAGALALAARLQRGTLAGWCAGFLAGGVLLGAMAGGADEMVGDNERTREIFRRMGGGADLTDAFLASVCGVLGVLAALFAIGAVLRAHDEEAGGRAGFVLSAPVGRLRWAGGHVMVAFAGSAVLMTAGAAGLAAGHGGGAGPLLGACLSRLPAVWLLAGVAVLLYGLAPGAARAAWGAGGAAVVISWIGPALDLPGPVLDLSPFTHLAKLPGQPMSWPPVVVLTALAVAATGCGMAALRRRDLGG